MSEFYFGPDFDEFGHKSITIAVKNRWRIALIVTFV